MASWARGRSVVAVGMVAVVVAAAALIGCQLPGAQFVVTTTTDGVDAAPGDGVCEVTPGAGDCSLRAAVMEANAEPGTNDIELGVGHTYHLTLAGADEEGAATGDLDLTDSVSINGASTIDGGQLDRVFDVRRATVIITGPTIRNGAVPRGDGGGIEVAGDAVVVLSHATVIDNAALEGAGIANRGRLQVVDSQVNDNHANPTGTSNVFGGGGIWSAGPLSVTRSTIAFNLVSPLPNDDDVTFVGNTGTAVEVVPPGTADIAGSTIGGQINVANDEGAPSSPVTIATSTVSDDQGQDVLTGGAFAITSSTLASGGEPIFGPGTTSTARGSALQDGVDVCASTTVLPPMVPAHVTSGGYNVASDATCALAGPADHQGVPLLLGSLGDNGGSTQTRLPFANSPVLDAIPNGTAGLCGSGTTDQRGVSRPANGRCDVGAVEGASVVAARPIHLVVISPGDAPDGTPGNGTCDAGPGGCTLRAAVDETNASPGADTITIAAGVNPVTAGLSVAGDLSIDGGGAAISLIPSEFDQRFRTVIRQGGNVTLAHMTLVADNTTVSLVDGGGGRLRLVDTTLIGSLGNGDPNSSDRGSIGVVTSSQTTIDSSTIRHNGGGAARMFNDGEIVSSTLTGNGTDLAGTFTINTGDEFEEPCQLPPTFTVSIVASTIVKNHSASMLLAGCPSRVTFHGSLVDPGTSFLCGPNSTALSLGYNLAPILTEATGEFGDCAAATATDQPRPPALLGPLASNGGPTQTFLALAGSGSLDRIPVGTPGLCVAGSVDQRHVVRPVGAACDIGATEGTTKVP